MLKNYKSPNNTITGTVDSPQTFLYTDLDDENGNALPATFDSIPAVMIKQSIGDCMVHFIPDSITTTQFQVALSDLPGDGTLGSVDVMFKIVGETT